MQEPCACRTSQGFSDACSYQAIRLTSPKGRSRSHKHRAPTLTVIPTYHVRLCAAHREYPDLRSCHLQKRRKWISTAISLIYRSNTTFILPGNFRLPHPEEDPSRTSRLIDRLPAVSGPALSLTDPASWRRTIANIQQKHVSGKQHPDGPDWPFGEYASPAAKTVNRPTSDSCVFVKPSSFEQLRAPLNIRLTAYCMSSLQVGGRRLSRSSKYSHG